jgi:uncharacterized membrane protein (UPF0127 family)
VEAKRFRGLPRRAVAGRLVPVASRRRARLLGLAFLDRERAGPGLLIPRCAAVHTFGMRFPLEVVFLDREGREIARREKLRPGRFAWERRAAAVLEIPCEDWSRCAG